MLKIAAWMTTFALMGVLAWQAVDAEPLLPRTMTALLLLVGGLLAGLRVGADSAAAYIRDLQRLNKVMAEHQQELEEVNSILLKQARLEANEPSERT
jgi:hypothetical protein